MGRSRGGLTSKIHALVDAEGRPIELRLTGGQVHDACEAEALIDAMPEGATLLGDKGYVGVRQTGSRPPPSSLSSPDLGASGNVATA
jgi:hypothetical protein